LPVKDNLAVPPQRGRTFAALHYLNYRLWFFGQMLSLFGTWMQSTAEGYLVFQLTHSSAYLGYVGFASGIPVWLFTLFAGVAADRMPRRRLLLLTQTCMLLLALVLAVLVFTQVVRPWHIVLLAFLLGSANAFDAPARQSFVLEMVGRQALSNAIALNSAMFNMAIVVGPALGGLAYAAFGPGWCFTLNALSFLAVIVALLAMRLSTRQFQQGNGAALQELREGLAYTISHPAIRVLIGIVAVASLFGMSFFTLVPAWAVRVLHGDAMTNGLLLSARGVGSLASALAIAALSARWRRGKVLVLASLVFPLMLLAFSFLRQLAASLLMLAAVGASMILVYNLANTLIQVLTEDRLRGRVMSFYSLSIMGLTPIGALLAGSLAQAIGEPNTVLLGAVVCLACAALVWFLFPTLRDLR
jgi:predicted MFS family arabinose efflux permease